MRALGGAEYGVYHEGHEGLEGLEDGAFQAAFYLMTLATLSTYTTLGDIACNLTKGTSIIFSFFPSIAIFSILFETSAE